VKLHLSVMGATGNTLRLRYRAQPVNAVYCENHTEHTDTGRTSQETHYVSTTEPNRLMLFTVRTIRNTNNGLLLVLVKRPAVSRSVGQSVLVSGTHVAPATNSPFSFNYIEQVREVGPPVFSCFWASPAQSFWGLSPAGLMTGTRPLTICILLKFAAKLRIFVMFGRVTGKSQYSLLETHTHSSLNALC
jgi:hypothetical protein